MNRRFPRETGFTLVEVLVALVVSALLVVLLIDGARSAIASAHRAKAREQALLIAQAVLTRAQVAPYGQSPAGGSESGFTWTLSEVPVLSDPRGAFVLSGLHVSVKSFNGGELASFDARRLKQLPRR